jgi:hypothetical protein
MNLDESNKKKLNSDLNKATKVQGNVDNVTRLLEEGADPNNTDSPLTPLVSAACKPNNKGVILTLIDHGADVNMPIIFGPDSSPIFPITMAARNETPNNMITLIDHGAIVNDRTIQAANHSNVDYLKREQTYQSRKPYISLVYGTPDATGHIDKYLSNAVAQQNIAEMIPPGDTTGGKKSRKQRRKIRKSRKYRHTKSRRHRRR